MPPCTATRSFSRTITAGGGPTFRTSSTRRSTATPTASASCSSWRSTSSTGSRGPTSFRKYLDLLAAGGSEAPATLLLRLGLDVGQPVFWQRGLGVLRRLVAEAVDLAAKVPGTA